MNQLFSSLKSSLASLNLSEKLHLKLPLAQTPPPFEPVWSDLKPEFFQGPQKWNWNASDLYPYYRLVFYSALAGMLLLTFLLLSLLQGAPAREAAAFERVVAALAAEPAEFQKQSARFLQKFPRSSYVAQVQSLSQQQNLLLLLKQINQAEHQPSLPLQVEAYQVLQKQSGNLPEAQRLKITDRLNRYSRMVQEYEAQLAKARIYSQKEYFTSSLLILAQLVKKGPQYGVLYLEAQELLNRTSVKKIDYYIVKGQLQRARIALADARYQGVSQPVLDELARKIKNLEQLKPLR